MIQTAGAGLYLPSLHCPGLQASCSLTDFYTLIEDLLCPEGRENAAVFQCRGQLFRQRGLVPALGTLFPAIESV